MGPPKSRPKVTPIDEVRRRYNCFEYRWHAESRSYYLFNPWTGETMFNTELEIVDRNLSMWSEPDKVPSRNAQNVILYPEFYTSRRWGRRTFHGFRSKQEAAIHITAVSRGYLVRQWIRRYYRSRYYLKMDPSSGYFYFVDTEHPHQQTSWHKPRLAFPGDILKLDTTTTVDDPDDYMKGKKYSKGDFTKGPIITIKGLNKADKSRTTNLEAFYAHNDWRSKAIRKYNEIDLDNIEMGTVIAWFDNYKATELELSSFNIVRASFEISGWDGVLRSMRAHPENLTIQIYGFYTFAKSDVPLDHSGVLDFASAEALAFSIEIIEDTQRSFPSLLKLFAFEAFHNILCVRAGRLEYLSTEAVQEQGELRRAAVERFLEAKFSVLLKYLTVIPTQNVAVFAKGAAASSISKRPISSAVDLVEITLKCLAVLAHESETKEQLAFLTVKPVMYTIDTCQEEVNINLNALQLLYNLCYRCEAGQEAILSSCNSREFFATVHHNHSGDPDVMRQCRRLELALKRYGWRGGVEELITREMKNEEIEEEFLMVSEYDRGVHFKK